MILNVNLEAPCMVYTVPNEFTNGVSVPKLHWVYKPDKHGMYDM